RTLRGTVGRRGGVRLRAPAETLVIVAGPLLTEVNIWFRYSLHARSGRGERLAHPGAHPGRRRGALRRLRLPAHRHRGDRPRRGRRPGHALPLPRATGGDPAALLGDRDARSPAALSAKEGRMSTFVAEATAAPTTLPPGPRTPRLWQSVRFALWPYATVEMAARRWGERYTATSIGERGK